MYPAPPTYIHLHWLLICITGSLRTLCSLFVCLNYYSQMFSLANYNKDICRDLVVLFRQIRLYEAEKLIMIGVWVIYDPHLGRNPHEFYSRADLIKFLTLLFQIITQFIASQVDSNSVRRTQEFNQDGIYGRKRI